MSLDITKLRSAENIQESGNLVVYDSGDDTLSTVMGAGYFDDAYRHLNVDDTIRVTHPNGVSDLRVSSITAGVVVVVGAGDGVQTIAVAGAVDVLNRITLAESAGAAQAMTLADGLYVGQLKTVVHNVDGGSLVLTPATALGFTTATFTTAGETATFMWTGPLGWAIAGFGGASATLPAFA